MTVAIIVASIISLCLLVRGATAYDGSSRNIFAAIAGVAVLSYLHAMVDFSLQIPGYLIMFGTLLGCGLAATCLPPQRRERSGSSRQARGEPMAGRGRPPEGPLAEKRMLAPLAKAWLPIGQTNVPSRRS
jgi:hypothetical protein